MKQRTFDEILERLEKEVKTRNELIDQIPADRRIKALLHCLIGFQHTVIGGEWHVQVSWQQIADKLLREINTVKSYVKGARPYVEILPSNHTKNTYVIHWMKIVDREQPHSRQAGSTAGESLSPGQAGSTPETADFERFDDPAEGGQPPPWRGSIPDREGGNFSVGGGQIGGQFATQLETSLFLQTGKPVLERCISKSPVLKPVEQGGKILGRRPEDLPEDLCKANIPKFRAAIASRNLANPEHVEELYYAAVRLKILPASPMNRLEVFIQAAVDVRLVRDQPYYVRRRDNARVKREPGNVFRENILYRAWTYRTNADVDTGRQMMKRVDMHTKRPGSDAEKSDTIAYVEAELERRRQERGAGQE